MYLLLCTMYHLLCTPTNTYFLPFSLSFTVTVSTCLKVESTCSLFKSQHVHFSPSESSVDAISLLSFLCLAFNYTSPFIEENIGLFTRRDISSSIQLSFDIQFTLDLNPFERPRLDWHLMTPL